MLKIISDSDISYLLSGAYVPLTMEGNILVDGILASCYPSVRNDLAHIGMTPMRWFPWMVEQIYGEGEGSGSPGYVEVARQWARWVLPYQQQYKMVNKL